MAISPRYAAWPRDVFLAARRAQHEAAKHITHDELAPGLVAEVFHIVPTDDIFCDACGADITTPLIHVVQRGNRAVCDSCLPRWRNA